MLSPNQISSSIKMRHIGKDKVPDTVLAQAETDIDKLTRFGRIDRDVASDLKSQVAQARLSDNRGKKEA